MKGRQIFPFVALLFAVGAEAQQNTFPFPSSGNVGIGTTAPVTPLQVVGQAAIGQNTNGTAIIDAYNGDAYYGNNSPTNGIAVDPAGNVGIGTTTPAEKLDVFGEIVLGRGTERISTGGGSFGFNRRVEDGYIYNSGAYAYQFQHIGGSTPAADYLEWQVYGPTGAGVTGNALVVNGSGNVGIGTTTPGAQLDVAGNIKLSGGGASITFPDGSVQSTAWSGTLCGGDYAESVNPVGGKTSYEPGDVLVISESAGGDVAKSSVSYSTLVAGIYSTKPGLLGRRQTGEDRDAELPMAMVGIVPTKVSAENGPIKKGDLLVTSSTAGYAMKGTDPGRMIGAVVGKALGNLDSSTGLIEVLITLQ